MITIDLRMVNHSGIGTYLRCLVPALMRQWEDQAFTLLGNREELAAFPWAAGEAVKLIDCLAPIYSIQEQIALAKVIPVATRLFWSPHYNIPLAYRGKLLVTVHDVFHLALPQFVHGWHKRLYARTLFASVRRSADAIICVSEFSRGELRRLTRGVSDQIHVVHNGIDPSWFNTVATTRLHERPYFLYVGNVKPHKNLFRLLQGFQRIQHEVPQDLVIVGQQSGFITGDNQVMDIAQSLGGRVRFTGFVDDARLRQYFIDADAFVFPSLYEGFGLPPLEAMASGCPVMVSRAASLPEICGDAALYCNPYDVADIAEKLKQLASDSGLRDILRQHGLQRAQNYSWDNAARETRAIMEQVIKQ